MKRNYSCPGIILQVQTIGEKNRLLDILTPYRGIVRATAYGAASPRSKLRSTTQSFYCGEIFFYDNPIKQYTKVVDIDLHSEFSGLREDTKKLYAASMLSELLLAVYGGNTQDSHAYALLHEYLTVLSKVNTDNVLRLLNLVLWRLLEILGEQPDLHNDVSSLSAFAQSATVAYSFIDGGLISEYSDMNLPLMEASERRFLMHHSRRTTTENLSLGLPEGADKRLFFLLGSIYEDSIGRPIKSLIAGFLP